MKTLATGVLCFVLGVLVALMARDRPPPPPPPPECPPAPVCPSSSGEVAHKPRPRAARKEKEPSPPPLPDLAAETEARRDRLREWFARSSQPLAACRPDGEPRRQLLMQLKLEPDGAVASATPIGAADLPPPTRDCVVKMVRELRVPADLLRGRETVLIHFGF